MKKLMFLLLCLVVVSCTPKVVQEVQTTLVKRGVFIEEITEDGEVKALNSLAVITPRIAYQYYFKVIQVVRDGMEVEKGDTLVVFDPTESKTSLISLEQQLETSQAELERLLVTQKAEIQDLESDLESSRLAYEIQKITTQQASYDSEVSRLENNLRLKTAEFALQRAQDNIENRKKVHKEDLDYKLRVIVKREEDIADAKNVLSSLAVVSPARGIAILKRSVASSNAKISVGDQVYAGSPLIDLPDLSVMTAQVNVSEVDVSKVKVGQKVIIRPDAYSDTTYSGTVMTIANLAQTKDYQSGIKVFPVKIKIDGQGNNLLPGLTVSCKIVIREQPDVLYIPLESLFRDEAGEYVYVQEGSGYKRREVKTGAMNADFAVVLEGVTEGEELSLSDPFLNKDEAQTKNGSADGKNNASSTN